MVGSEDPRVTRSRRAVLAASVEELAERGYGGFTIDGVARRSGVARSTIYRLWSGKLPLVDEALSTLNPPPAELASEAPPTAYDLLHHLDQALNTGPVAACLPALVDGAERDPAVRRLHHTQSRRRRRAMVEAVGRARPEVAGTRDAELIADALAGALFYTRLMSPRRLSRADLDRLVGLLLPEAADGAESRA